MDARPREEYAAGHLPGAVVLPWEEWCGHGPVERCPLVAEPGYWGRLADADPDWYAQRLGEHGLRHDVPIVVYAGGLRSKGREGRIAWMLLYLGAQEVYLLDGGWQGWRTSGGLVETTSATPMAAQFMVRPDPRRRACFDALRAAYHQGTMPRMVDARSLDEFAGRQHPYLPRMGHLPGAVLLPFADLFAPDGRFVDRARYLEALPEALRADVPAASYCEVSLRASTVALLHEIHTGHIMAVFDGSLMEWSLDPTLPILTEST